MDDLLVFYILCVISSDIFERILLRKWNIHYFQVGIPVVIIRFNKTNTASIIKPSSENKSNYFYKVISNELILFCDGFMERLYGNTYKMAFVHGSINMSEKKNTLTIYLNWAVVFWLILIGWTVYSQYMHNSDSIGFVIVCIVYLLFIFLIVKRVILTRDKSLHMMSRIIAP